MTTSSARAAAGRPRPSVDDMDNPFAVADADGEWSDQEVLLPQTRRKKTPYVPMVIPDDHRPSPGTETTSSDEWLPPMSPVIPPKSPSRPELRPGALRLSTELRPEALRMSSNHDDLVQRYYQVSRERDALRKELQRQSVGTHGLSARASVVYKSDEKSLIEELYGLREEIRIWSEEYFSGPPTSRSRRPHLHSAKELFGSLTDNYNAYVKHNRDRPLLIQSFIWSRLQQRIFSTLHKGCGYIWAGKLGDRKLRPINDTLRKAVKNEEQAEEYHRWRAMTVNLLVPQVDGKWAPTYDATPVLKWIKRFCSRLRRRLRPWSTQSLRLGKEQLYTIVSAAVALDLKMKRQRADYRFITWTGGKPNQFWGYGFYDSEMEDIDEEMSSSRRVELSLAPALERCGNANGHVFDQNFILVKADVTCKRIDRTRDPNRRKGSSRKGVTGFLRRE